MNRYVRAALLGAVSGMRSSAAPLAAGWAKTRSLPVGNAVAFAGEIVADKLPFTPSRMGVGPLLGRAGAAVYGVRRFNGAPATPVTDAIAALAAIGSAYAFSQARGLAAQRGKRFALSAAIAEDALCLGLVVALVWRR